MSNPSTQRTEGITNEDIKETVRNHLTDFLPSRDVEALTDSTPLITGGVLDSITLVELVAVLEDRYGVNIQPHEMSVDYFDSLDDIAATVQSKMAEQ